MMQHLFQRLFGKPGIPQGRPSENQHADDVQVMVPEAVQLPLPKAPWEEISVPASINGRDLSSGRL